MFAREKVKTNRVCICYSTLLTMPSPIGHYLYVAHGWPEA